MSKTLKTFVQTMIREGRKPLDRPRVGMDVVYLSRQDEGYYIPCAARVVGITPKRVRINVFNDGQTYKSVSLKSLMMQLKPFELGARVIRDDLPATITHISKWNGHVYSIAYDNGDIEGGVTTAELLPLLEADQPVQLSQRVQVTGELWLEAGETGTVICTHTESARIQWSNGDRFVVPLDILRAVV